MKKMLSKVLALTLVVALGLGLTGGAFAAEPQTGTFDIQTGPYDYGQMVNTVVINLDQPVGEVTAEEVAAAFSVSVGGIYEQTLYGVNEMELHPRTVETAEVSEDGLTITLGLTTTYSADSTYGVVKYAVPSDDAETNGYISDGYTVTLTTDLGDLTTDLALTFSGTVTDPVVDKWGAVAETDTTYKYRWYDPSAEYEAPETGYPLIVWLHGQGEFGEDNAIQITANRVTAWGEPETQDIFGGAYVIAPQGPGAAALDPVNGGWIADKVMATIMAFVEQVGNVDMNRIVIGGCSMGGIGTWRTVLANPDFFAAAFPVCGANFDGWVTESVISVLDLPVYLIHSIDDGTVNVSGSIDAYNAITAGGGEKIHLALFDHVKLGDVDSNTMPFSFFLGHFSWVYAHNDITATEEFWTNEYVVTAEDGTETVYETDAPADLGYTSFKAWLAAQVRPEAGTYFTRNRDIVVYGETIDSVTVHGLEPIDETVTDAADYLAETPIVITVDGAEREIAEVVISEDRTALTFVFVPTLAFDPVGGAAAKYVVTVDGEEIVYGGDTGDSDKFDSVTYVVPSYVLDKTGETLNTMSARYFTPDKEAYPSDSGYPLVIWLHGTGEIGFDNRIQISCADVPAWTEKEAQDIFGGAYVLAPQNHSYADQKGDKAPEATMSLIQQFMADHPDIDPTRIYVGGCSYGGRATFELIREYPNFFAAAFPTCASIYTPGTFEFLTDEELEWLLDVPIYMLVSSGDNASYNHSMITFYNNMMELGAENLHFAIFEHSMFDEYPTEMLPVGTLDHWVWGYAHDNFDGLGDDWDGKMFIDSDVDGTYNDGKVVIEDGVYTYYYEWEGEETSIVLNGETERPGDLGFDTFMEWIAAQVNPTPSVFDDVAGDSEYYDAVMAIYAAGVTNGTSATTYEPTAPLTRAEFVTFLTRALGITVDNTVETVFTDVAVGSWETGSVAWGAENGILLGYGDGTFGPEDPVTETQVNLIIGRLIEQQTGVAGMEVIPGATDVPATRGLAATILASFLAM